MKEMKRSLYLGKCHLNKAMVGKVPENRDVGRRPEEQPRHLTGRGKGDRKGDYRKSSSKALFSSVLFFLPMFLWGTQNDQSNQCLPATVSGDRETDPTPKISTILEPKQEQVFSDG